MHRPFRWLAALALLFPFAPAWADDEGARLGREFDEVIRPFLAANCAKCHGGDKPKAALDLAAWKNLAAVTAGHRHLAAIAEQIETREMPPETAKAQPTAEERARVLAFITALRKHEASKASGDPGPVLARRLSNAEYDYTIRDLLGVDLRPTREFPVDPANEAGFDNSGESLAMSPALLKKYVETAKTLAAHLVLKPQGFVFAPHPVLSETDRDKYAVLRIIDFYKRQPTDLARYFQAAWRFQHRAALGQPKARLAEIAAAEQVSPRYLAMVVEALDQPEELGPLATVQAMFRNLPAPADGAVPATLAPACNELRGFVEGVREKLVQFWPNIRLKAVATGSQPFILWKNTQYATHRTSFDRKALWVQPPDQSPREIGKARAAEAGRALAALARTAFGADLPTQALAEVLAPVVAPDPMLAIPPGEAARKRHEAAFARFAKVFPDAFYVSERGRVHLDRSKERADKGRYLSAGYHNMMGYFRDDLPLYQYILDDAGRRELDGLWRELDFITHAPTRQHADFIFYERAEPPRTIKGPEFDFVRSEDKASTSDAMIRRLAKVYLEKARQSLTESRGDAHAIPVLEGYFEDVRRNIRRAERDRKNAEPSHLTALVAFAERAYRRPLAASERADLLAYYRSLRKAGDPSGPGGLEGLDHEEAMRDAVASVLVSPNFLFRIDLVDGGAGARPLSPYALASRLSYFLWSSLPDAELLARAKKGDLPRKEVLVAQARRMLADPKARALAVEFAGNWLDFRRFEEHNSVDRQRFPSFDPALRQAMFEEPVRFFDDVARNNGSVLDLLFGQHTFVNPVLAKHYGIPGVTKDEWVPIDDARPYGRGGLLPMAVFLTKNAPGLRTSPVKRGYWVVRRALGEMIPPPPPTVPELPNDEQKMGKLTVREALAKHREDPGCAGCHARFDSFGLAFEGYGPIGEVRSKDLGGRPVDTRATFPGGGEGTGVEGLRAYLRTRRQGDFVENFTRKLYAYALGRSLQLSDDPTIARLRARLEAGGYQLANLVADIVETPQFLTKRGRVHLAQREDVHAR